VVDFTRKDGGFDHYFTNKLRDNCATENCLSIIIYNIVPHKAVAEVPMIGYWRGYLV
jgi:hypothetical protein